MAAGILMAGLTLAGGASDIIGGRDAQDRAEKAIEESIKQLRNENEFAVQGMRERIGMIAKDANLNVRERILQARREAGKIRTGNANAGAAGITANALEGDAYSRAGTESGFMLENADRGVRATHRDILASKLSLKNQIAGLEAGAPQAPNPFLQALSIGTSAAASYYNFKDK